MRASRILCALSMTSLFAGCSGQPETNTSFGSNGSSIGSGNDDDEGSGDAEAEADEGEAAASEDGKEDDEGEAEGNDDEGTSTTGEEDDDEGTTAPSIKFDVWSEGQEAEGLPVGNCENRMYGVLRDFLESHPDMEREEVGLDLEIVDVDLGSDGKPVYAPGSGGTSPTTSGQEAFDQWFRDVPDVNMPLPIRIPLYDPEGDGTYTFEDSTFFPADGEGLGEETLGHNYHFTLEIRTSFTYDGGEVFSFSGDDDLFVFVNNKLAMNLGGVHLPLTRTIDMDAQAEDLGLTLGESYTLDFFFAERKTSMSNFRIDTSIACFVPEG